MEFPSDVWNIPFLNPKAKERVGYPTQKPILLLEQIIKIATDKNDIVLDPVLWKWNYFSSLQDFE